MGRSRYKVFEEGCPYFMTCTVVQWLPIFADPDTAKIVLQSLQFLQKTKRWNLYGYVILENHLHLIAAALDIKKEIANFKSYTARKIIDLLIEKNAKDLLRQLGFSKLRHKGDRDYQLWQEGYHPEMIQNEFIMRQKLEYIHNNPVKRGYVDNPLHWRYSSARNYFGKEAIIEIFTRW